MGMNYLQRFIKEVRVLLFFSFLMNNFLLVMLGYYVFVVWEPPMPVEVSVMLAGLLFCNFVLERIVSGIIMQPLKLLWQNILHTAPTTNLDPQQDKAAIKAGLDLVDHLSRHVHQLAMAAYSNESKSALASPDHHRNFIANSLPLPLIVLGAEDMVLFANIAALRYFGIAEEALVGQSMRHHINLRFGQTEQSLADWIDNAKAGSVTAMRSWDDVRHVKSENETLHFDLAAFYNKDNPEGIETMLVFFDHTATYSQFDADVGFVALAIHELRTPVTILRGYIEALDEDLEGTLEGEAKEFFDKMKVSSHQLTSFIDNILNVARIESNQLDVQLHEEDWGGVIRAAAKDLSLRAEVRGLEVELEIADNLPTVAVDRFSATAVLTNLVDNAIKYSAGKGKRIIVKAELNGDGFVETTVKDFGVGIAQSVVPTLFDKFQRNYHNRASVGGSGLGLYLSKVIVTLHGGNIWVSSKEGKSTTVGFTVIPFKDIDKGKLSSDAGDIVPRTHGWIKNHSMSRH